MKTICVLLLLSCAGPVAAQCYQRSYSYAPSYSYTPVATVVVPIAQYVSIPFYSAVYVPPATTTTTTITQAAPQQQAAPSSMPSTQQQAASPCQETALVLKELLVEMRAMRTDQAMILRGTMPNKQQQAAPPSKSEEDYIATAAVAVLKKPIGMSGVSCASCHVEGGNPDKSAGFHMFSAKGDLLRISESLAQAMARKIRAERKCPARRAF